MDGVRRQQIHSPWRSSLRSRYLVSGVSCSPALKWVFGLLLVLSLGSKWALSVYSPPFVNEQEEKAAEGAVVRFLVQNHFSIVRAGNATFEMEVIEATAGLCRLQVVLSASRGWHRDLIRTMMKPGEQTFVVFGGKIYPDQPMLLTITDFLWYKLLTKLGIGAHPTPVVTVMAEPNCGADRLAWNEFK
jgi:hypothetical protein